MITEYKTILTPSEIEFIEKKSRFIGYAAPVITEEQALEFIRSVKAKHRDATHNVYAYITRDNNISRYTDDGEPSGTAGLPVLDSLRKAGFTDAAIVVTRYFGGTLLGTGGLVKAYSAAASKALAAAKPVIKRLSKIYKIICPYDLHGLLEYSLLKNNFKIENTAFTDKVTIVVGIPFENAELLEKTVVSVTSGKAKAELIGEDFVNSDLLNCCNNE